MPPKMPAAALVAPLMIAPISPHVSVPFCAARCSAR
jgi:hypothetical protein